MRLLRCSDFKISEFNVEIPPYAILSHCWGQEEVTYQDVLLLNLIPASPEYSRSRNRIQAKEGWAKIKHGASTALNRFKLKYIWVDTCCIDKTSSAELSETINSIYRLYQQSSICLAYLSDVAPGSGGESVSVAFQNSRWFTRGWTLQELIAPREVFFYAKDWSILGSKRDRTLMSVLAKVTGIDRSVLSGATSLEDVSVAARMKWASKRQTTREEDIAYCLLGIFDINMPLLYGEGMRAFIRLQEEIGKSTDDHSIFAWTSPSGANCDPDKLELCGLLAESPRWFQDSRSYHSFPTAPTESSIPWSVTNKGLHINLCLQQSPRKPEEFNGILDCFFRTPEGVRSPVITLRKLWGDQYARVYPGTFKLAATRPNRRETIYVRQRQRWSPPAFRIAEENSPAPGSKTEHENYELTDVFPTLHYDDLNLSLATPHASVNGLSGVFRFQNTRFPDLFVDVAVGLKRGGDQHTWTPWVFQMPRKGSLPALQQEYCDIYEIGSLAQVPSELREIQRQRLDWLVRVRPIPTEVLGGPRAKEDRDYFTTTTTVEKQENGKLYHLIRIAMKSEIAGGIPVVPSKIFSDHIPRTDILHDLRADAKVMLDYLTQLYASPGSNTVNGLSSLRGLLSSGSGQPDNGQRLGLTPTHVAAFFGMDECLKELGEEKKRLIRASNWPSNLDWVYRNSAPYMTNGSSQTIVRPIHLAAANGHLSCVKVLWENGEDPRALSTHHFLLPPSRSNSTPQLVSFKGNAEDIVQLRLNSVPTKDKESYEGILSYIASGKTTRRRRVIDGLEGRTSLMLPSRQGACSVPPQQKRAVNIPGFPVMRKSYLF